MRPALTNGLPLAPRLWLDPPIGIPRAELDATGRNSCICLHPTSVHLYAVGVLGRRLLILAAVLLATGAMAAALTPRDLRQGDEPRATTAAPPPPRSAGGTPPGAREASFVVDGSRRRPAVLRVRQGTLIHLSVKAPAPDEVELEGLGRSEPVDPYSPARFDFFAQGGGTFPIRLRQADREVGRLVIRARPL